MKSRTPTALFDLRARDLMRTEVACLSPEDTIESALQSFEELRISGAPVVDGAGRMVGVLTLSDVARPEHTSGDRLETAPREFDLAEESEGAGDELPGEVFFAKEDYSVEVRGRELVSDWMAEEVLSVRPDAPLSEVCEAMVNQGIHRLFVTQGDKLVGVVSSFDVMRAVAQARQVAPRAKPRSPRGATHARRHPVARRAAPKAAARR